MAHIVRLYLHLIAQTGGTTCVSSGTFLCLVSFMVVVNMTIHFLDDFFHKSPSTWLPECFMYLYDVAHHLSLKCNRVMHAVLKVKMGVMQVKVMFTCSTWGYVVHLVATVAFSLWHQPCLGLGHLGNTSSRACSASVEILGGAASSQERWWETVCPLLEVMTDCLSLKSWKGWLDEMGVWG